MDVMVETEEMVTAVGAATIPVSQEAKYIYTNVKEFLRFYQV
jgi:hypothetical protein